MRTCRLPCRHYRCLVRCGREKPRAQGSPRSEPCAHLIYIIGRADDDELVKPEAFVVLNDPSDACNTLVDNLLEHCKNGLARYKYPRWIHFVDDLPKTATGKIQRFRLRQTD